MVNVRRCMRSAFLTMFIIMLIVILSIYGICTCNFDIHADDGVELFILMYHNIIGNNERPNKYEIRLCDLESDIKYIDSLGMDIVTPSDIYLYRAGKKKISNRAVMLTFDDGYYSYVTRLLPLIRKYNISVEVNVVGEYTALNKDRADLSRRYTYLDYDDIAVLDESGLVEIGYHSYYLHHTGGRKNGASAMRGETHEAYKERLIHDTALLRDRLEAFNIHPTVYAYPFGAYSRSSDSILREMGISMTLSCSEGVNHVTKDSSLYLMRRYNRSGIGGTLREMYAFFR